MLDAQLSGLGFWDARYRLPNLICGCSWEWFSLEIVPAWVPDINRTSIPVRWGLLGKNVIKVSYSVPYRKYHNYHTHTLKPLKPQPFWSAGHWLCGFVVSGQAAVAQSHPQPLVLQTQTPKKTEPPLPPKHPVNDTQVFQ